jgi:hypothetical protein
MLLQQLRSHMYGSCKEQLSLVYNVSARSLVMGFEHSYDSVIVIILCVNLHFEH